MIVLEACVDSTEAAVMAVAAGAAGRIIVMPGVGIDSAMRFRKEGMPMGRSCEPDEYSRLEPDAEEIAAIARALREHTTP